MREITPFGGDFRAFGASSCDNRRYSVAIAYFPKEINLPWQRKTPFMHNPAE